ncbi:uncharacterized protein PHACADRAFT_251121 [Phanerochaete carnosa HHB-10118-sp]|uniref:DUF6535 domain-containing protein n=1 Tax=Phanerochaete carnosa (strain HHB-10118-sp) TaxID=650164 RepID=K5X3S0_PHACS|nr:uncharacterized protein PHACADRAFT_251121 [Phanerochaete carnosa HHB-10118-sp]EKM57457.1 hypothetical protein PHACADRAFT_251121 [Phanerochaete carnosa HHB-10118-sp]
MRQVYAVKLATRKATPLSAPQASAQLINEFISPLFFASRVFGLAAVLFDDLPKQRLRAYIRWNSPLPVPHECARAPKPPRAQKTWNVEAITALTPTLIDLTRVLFFAGIVVLLWTLDVVTAVITVVASAFLQVFPAVTVPPLIFRCIPYELLPA